MKLFQGLISSIAVISLLACSDGDLASNQGGEDVVEPVKTTVVIIDGDEVIQKKFGDESFKLTISDRNDGEMTYFSSNPKVATVDSQGKVTIVGAGKAVITVTEAGSANYAGQTAKVSLNIDKAPGETLKISGKALINKRYGDAPFNVAVSGGNKGAIRYQSSDPKIATVDSQGKVTIVGAGKAVITVTEADSANYVGQTAKVALNIAKAAGGTLKISGKTAINKRYGDAPFSVAVSGGNKGAIRYQSSDPKVATVDAQGKVTIVGAGKAVITVSEADSANYVGQTAKVALNIAKAPGETLKISGKTAINKRYGDAPFSVAVSGGNKGAIRYQSSDPKVATVDAQGKVTIVGAGKAVITVTEADSLNYVGKTAKVALNIAKAAGGTLKIKSKSPISKRYGDKPFNVAVSGGNKGAIRYQSSDPKVATVDAQGKVTIVGAGKAVITVSEADSLNYVGQTAKVALNIAKAAGGTLKIKSKSTISKRYGDKPFSVAVSGGNKGVIRYQSSDPKVAKVDAQGKVTIVGAGSAKITVQEAASDNYKAQSASFTLTVEKAVGEALDAGLKANKVFGDEPFTQAVSGGNGGDITYTSSDPNVATVAATGMISIVGVGSAKITVQEATSDNYKAQSASFMLTVEKGTGKALNIGKDVVKNIDEQSFSVAAGGNGGTITYTSSNLDIASVDANGLVSLVGLGMTTITVTEAASNNYKAQSESFVLTVDKEGEHAVTSISSAHEAYAALRQDGSVVAWGSEEHGGKMLSNGSDVSAQLNGKNPVISIQSNKSAFAAVREDGSVVTWGKNEFGGTLAPVRYDLTPDGEERTWYESPDLTQELNGDIGVVDIVGSYGAFAALRRDGSVIAWGNPAHGGRIPTEVVAKLNGENPVKHIYTNGYSGSFAAVRLDGSVITWGAIVEDVPKPESSEILDIYSNANSFAALLKNGRVISWGHQYLGGTLYPYPKQTGEQLYNIRHVVSNLLGYAALREDGVAVAWGLSQPGTLISSGLANVDRLKGDNPISKIVQFDGFFFAAQRQDGSVVIWGDETMQGAPRLKEQSISEKVERNSPMVQSTFNGDGYAWLYEDGSVATFPREEGASGYDENAISELNGDIPVVYITQNGGAFAALRQDGSVVTWGDAEHGGVKDIEVSSKLDGSNPITSIYSNQYSFAALRQDGSVVTWGNPDKGGDSAAVASQIAGGYLDKSTSLDTDRDGISNIDERRGCSVPYTQIGQLPCLSAGHRDSDGDGVFDGLEQKSDMFNPLKASSKDRSQDVNQDGYPDHWVLPQQALAMTSELQALPDVNKVLGDDPFPVEVGEANKAELSYVSSDTSVATVDSNGLVTLMAVGTSVISVIQADSGKSNMQKVSFLLSVEKAHGQKQNAVSSLMSNKASYAALRQDGSVVTWGEPKYGGTMISNGVDVSEQLNGFNPVKKLISTNLAFAALRKDGSVVAWGYQAWGGALVSDGEDVSAKVTDDSNPVIDIFGSISSFAALRRDGSVVTWGDSATGGTMTSNGADVSGELDGVALDVLHIYSNDYSFAALRQDGSVVTWGDAQYGGDSSQIQNQLDNPIVNIYTTHKSYAALFKDGSVQTWGDPVFGGAMRNTNGNDISNQLNGDIKVTKIYSHLTSFAAVREDGSVVSWGDDYTGGEMRSNGVDVSEELNGDIKVDTIFGNDNAFAALREDGSVVTWGEAEKGGVMTSNEVDVSDQLDGRNRVVTIFGNYHAFAALREDGSVITWGSEVGGGNLEAYSYNTTPDWNNPHWVERPSVSSQLDGSIPVVYIYSTWEAFAALRKDGSVVTWGGPFSGGQATSNRIDVSKKLNGDIPVIHISSNNHSFAALRQDGSVVTWGEDIRGGNSEPVSSLIAGGHVSEVPALDTDDDGISNIDELASCTVPFLELGQRACLSAGNRDTDGDGIYDKFEKDYMLNPLKASSAEQNNDVNGDGFPDHWVGPQFSIAL
ncbi:Ig-like domain-containing protein [Motilimonas eburnea]|uniref:Ig-like domain-containing protein n=1 Tax=Motilimonas eburnea TaxID=1737488 RepID=UPI001E5D0180|nr:Ig-like domain-containing protein [Motilimonas eburnea]MCE2572840.1 Ig-like domain-containing protein [Motilimonas eburnea]